MLLLMLVCIYHASKCKMADANKVLLGVVDAFLDTEEDVNAGWSTNKFGGVPNWMPDCLPSYHPKCGNCNAFLYQIAQIYCPLEGHKHHRTLYIFGCLSKDCRSKQGSWVALRCQFIDEKEANGIEPCQVADNITQDFWCADANDWGIDDENEMQKVDLSFGRMTTVEKDDEAESKSVTATTEAHNARDESYSRLCDNRPPHFCPLYVHVLEEPESSFNDSFDYEFRLLREYEAREGLVKEESSHTKTGEKYEKTSISDGDRAFHKFQKRIRFCKEQCLRYKWNGRPLLLSEKVMPNVSIERIPACLNCGSERVFEMQLMPALVSHLSLVDDEGIPQGACMFEEGTRMDFGTIFVYTCSRSCDRTDNGYRVPVDEFVAMQPCPDSEIFQNFVK